MEAVVEGGKRIALVDLTSVNFAHSASAINSEVLVPTTVANDLFDTI